MRLYKKKYKKIKEKTRKEKTRKENLSFDVSFELVVFVDDNFFLLYTLRAI